MYIILRIMCGEYTGYSPHRKASFFSEIILTFSPTTLDCLYRWGSFSKPPKPAVQAAKPVHFRAKYLIISSIAPFLVAEPAKSDFNLIF
jgi:hypothetical protein